MIILLLPSKPNHLMIELTGIEHKIARVSLVFSDAPNDPVLDQNQPTHNHCFDGDDYTVVVVAAVVVEVEAGAVVAEVIDVVAKVAVVGTSV